MKKIKILAIALSVSMILVGCKNEKNMEITKEKEESILNLEEINLSMVNPDTINPILNKNKTVAYVLDLVYDGLFKVDENYNTVPELVDSYEMYENGVAIDIKLKEAYWHDNTRVTANDVRFTIELIRKNTESAYYEFVKNIGSVSIKNDDELTIRFTDKYAFSKDTLIFPIVSQKQLSNSGDIKEYKANIIGNGPYKITKYEERKNLELEVNKNYYKEISNKAKNIIVKIVPDKEAEVSMVMSLNSDISNISINDLSKFYNKQFKITNFEGREFEGVVFNYDNPLIQDLNFRKAVASVIDKNRIVEEGYIGEAKKSDFPLNTKSYYYNSDAKSLELNQENALKYLKSIKLTEQNKDIESEEKEENKSQDEKSYTQDEINNIVANTNLKIIVNKNNSERIKSAYIISEGLKSIGIKSQIQELDTNEMNVAFSNKEYDLAMIGWELSSVPDVSSIINGIGYNDEKLQLMMEKLINSTTQSEITNTYKEIQEYVNNNVLFISLAVKNDYIVMNKRIQGKLNSNSFNLYNGIENLNI